MVIFGVDAHKRTHTVVAVDGVGRQLGSTTTTATTTNEHLALRRWAQDFGPDRVWAVEDCRHLSRRFEADLLRAGEEIVRVPPKLMAHTRASARTCGKSDPIDALAVAQAALRHPDLPRAGLDDPSRTLRLLVDYRDDLLTDRTAWTNRLRWHLHELDPTWDPPARALSRLAQLDTILARLGTYPSDHIVARVATNEARRIRDLTTEINQLEREITERVQPLAPTLLAIPGVGALTAAKILGEVANILRFHTKEAFARHNGTAPIPVWSGNTTRHRLSRTGNRQLNCALHRIAITQTRHHPDAKAYLERRRTLGNTGPEARRALKRRLSDVIYRALQADAALNQPHQAAA